jgi:hypothetical protein
MGLSEGNAGRTRNECFSTHSRHDEGAGALITNVLGHSYSQAPRHLWYAGGNLHK